MGTAGWRWIRAVRVMRTRTPLLYSPPSNLPGKAGPERAWDGFRVGVRSRLLHGSCLYWGGSGSEVSRHCLSWVRRFEGSRPALRSPSVALAGYGAKRCHITACVHQIGEIGYKLNLTKIVSLVATANSRAQDARKKHAENSRVTLFRWQESSVVFRAQSRLSNRLEKILWIF